ncbi:MAG: hypothetical protein DRI57_16160 [Deltaproteobacteria bacterium]|nr:MAG: hypothetical protein DRI57_16160 [Deltaproteobacteria bacterium]
MRGFKAVYVGTVKGAFQDLFSNSDAGFPFYSVSQFIQYDFRIADHAHGSRIIPANLFRVYLYVNQVFGRKHLFVPAACGHFTETDSHSDQDIHILFKNIFFGCR